MQKNSYFIVERIKKYLKCPALYATEYMLQGTGLKEIGTI